MMKRLPVLLLFLLLGSLLVTPPARATDDTSWAFKTWPYRTPITISNMNTYNLTDFQVKVIFNGSWPGWAHVSEDGSDIRFALPNGTEVPYWIENWNLTAKKAIVWIRVPSIPANGTAVVYVYYGNSQAESESNGSLVFDFFDDFENLDNWNVNVSGGKIEVTAGRAYTGATSVYIYDSDSGKNYLLAQNTLIDKIRALGRYRLSVMVYDKNSAADSQIFVLELSDGTNPYILGVNTEVSTSYYSWRFGTTWHESSVVRSEGWHKLEFVNDGSSIRGYIDGTEVMSEQSADITEIYLGSVWTPESSESWWDALVLRKYADEEPTVTIGAEECRTVALTLNFSDGEGNTLSGVHVYIDGDFYGVVDSGESIVVTSGPHTLSALKPGYLGIDRTLNLSDDTVLSLTLRKSNTYHALSFDGQDDYVTFEGSALENLKAITIAILAEVDGNGTLISWGDASHTKVRISGGKVAFSVSNGSLASVGTYWTTQVLSYKSHYLIIATANTTSGDVRIVVNNKTVLEGNLDLSVIESSEYHRTKYIASLGGSDFFRGKIYLVLIYNRTLTSSEITRLYEDPMHPPQGGILLWYSPDSVDAEHALWLDKSNYANDGGIHGATLVRISLPAVSAWDGQQNTPISVYTLSIRGTDGTTYIPWFLPLPYDVPVTLNVSAPGYYPSLYTVQAPMLSLNFTLTPVTTYVTIAKAVAMVYVRGGNESKLTDFLNLFKFWPGGDIGAKFLRLHVREAIQSFFNDTTIPFLGVAVALLIWGSGVLMAWVYSGEPEFVALWGLALYLGLRDFIVLDSYLTVMNAAVVPFAFVISMLYLKKVLSTFGGE